MSVAAGLGLRVAAVERDRVGGDCLWSGCVPSKALLASARAAHTIRRADEFGLDAPAPAVDTARVLARIRAIQARIATSDDDPDRLRAAGVDLVLGAARLTGPHTVRAGGRVLRTGAVLVCTGSRPAVPGVPGLAEAGHLTADSLWSLERAPASLVIVGGGPAGIELAQGLRRLDVPVTVLQRGPRILPRDEPALTERLTRRLRAEGVVVETGVHVDRVAREDGMAVVHAGGRAWRAHEVLVATGRRPNVEGLGLEELGIGVTPDGVAADTGGRTAVPSVLVAGDLAGRFRFTHSAGYEAARAVRNLAAPGAETAPLTVPWVTFTDPELAHVGLTEAEARERHGDRAVRVWTHDLEHSDRARTDGAQDGEIRVVTVRGRIAGGHALAPAAGELVGELALAIAAKRRLTGLAGVVHAYPTYALALQQLGGEAAQRRARPLRPLLRLWARRG